MRRVVEGGTEDRTRRIGPAHGIRGGDEREVVAIASGYRVTTKSSPSGRRVTSRFGRSISKAIELPQGENGDPPPQSSCFGLCQEMPATTATMMLATISTSSRTMPGGVEARPVGERMRPFCCCRMRGSSATCSSVRRRSSSKPTGSGRVLLYCGQANCRKTRCRPQWSPKLAAPGPPNKKPVRGWGEVCTGFVCKVPCRKPKREGNHGSKLGPFTIALRGPPNCRP
jgi:hypothetical protein